ncbi:CLAVATA3/ESR-RELATED 16 [Euphorbia peplus]|nr:CLAVATA3/ESR-RELATED 16 [Euphorbia peplus]
MTVHKGGNESSICRGRRAMFIVLLIWVFLIFAQLVLFNVVRGEREAKSMDMDMDMDMKKLSSSRSLPRKVRVLATTESFFHSSSSSAAPSPSSVEGDPESNVYEDDKRIIHTGPNPLHN